MIITGYDDYTPMKWKQEFSVGSSEIDKQHKKLTAFYNGALVHCSGDRIKEREYFDTVIEAFINLLEEHFDTEEQIFSGTDYPHMEEHILDHVKLLEKMNSVKKEIQNSNWRMELHILAITLKDWLMYHFKVYDSDAKEYFRAGEDLQPEKKREAVSA